jgi:hypothetical protein
MSDIKKYAVCWGDNKVGNAICVVESDQSHHFSNVQDFYDTKLEALNKAYRAVSSKIRELENMKDDIFEHIIMERGKE